MQNVYPTSDISQVGTWNTPLWSKIDEEPYSDLDYAVNNPSTGSVSFTVHLGDATDPADHELHTLYVRLKATDDDYDVEVKLLQGAITTIALIADTLLADGNFHNWEYTLTEGQAALITDYTDLRLRVTGTPANGLNAYLTVSYAMLEYPDLEVYPDVVIPVAAGQDPSLDHELSVDPDVVLPNMFMGADVVIPEASISLTCTMTPEVSP